MVDDLTCRKCRVRSIENKKIRTQRRGIKPKQDHDLLDGGSKKEIESHPRRKTERVLASRSPQLDSSSREEMYYPIQSTTRVAPPWYPHVRLDEDSLILIPKEVKERLARSQ